MESNHWSPFTFGFTVFLDLFLLQNNLSALKNKQTFSFISLAFENCFALYLLGPSYGMCSKGILLNVSEAVSLKSPLVFRILKSNRNIYNLVLDIDLVHDH